MTLTKRQHLTCLHHDDQSSTSQGASPAHAIPDFATFKRVGTETIERVQRAASFLRPDRRQKALIISCSYDPLHRSFASDTPTASDTAELKSPATLSPRTTTPAAAVQILDEPVQRSKRDDGQLSVLQHAHKDGYNLKNMLENKFHFKHIELLIDEGEPASASWPTGKNIRAAIKRLVEGASPGDNFVFAFIGHGGQAKSKGDTELDGLDEYIVAADDEMILDDELNVALVERLPDGCKMTAIFDCCHSGTMMDLKLEHWRINTKASELVAKRAAPPCPPLQKLIRVGTRVLRSGFRRPFLRPGTPGTPTRTIIALSACRDEENAWEFKNGNSLTDLLVKVIDEHGFVTCSHMHHRLTKAFETIGKIMHLRHRANTTSFQGQRPVLSAQKPIHKRELFIADPPQVPSRSPSSSGSHKVTSKSTSSTADELSPK